MDCSDGAKMLIDQMKANPEEFRGYAGKFTNLLDTAQDVVRGGAVRGMSARDAAAIVNAAQTYLFEVWLAEDVLTAIMQPKEEPAKYSVGMTLSASGSLGVGTQAPSKLYVTNSTIKHRMELERQRQQANEYAMRNTKPFVIYL
jgi:hypothetical protein